MVVLGGMGTLSSAKDERSYGKAGCGLGSVIIGKDGNQILAITSNMIAMFLPRDFRWKAML